MEHNFKWIETQLRRKDDSLIITMARCTYCRLELRVVEAAVGESFENFCYYYEVGNETKHEGLSCRIADARLGALLKATDVSCVSAHEYVSRSYGT